MNRMGKIIVFKGIDKKYNEYKEFYEREIEVYICVVFMEMVGMEIMYCKLFLILLDIIRSIYFFYRL